MKTKPVPLKEFYDTQDLADLLGVTTRTISNLCQRGHFYPIDGLGKKLFPRAQIDAFAKKTRKIRSYFGPIPKREKRQSHEAQ